LAKKKTVHLHNVKRYPGQDVVTSRCGLDPEWVSVELTKDEAAVTCRRCIKFAEQDQQAEKHFGGRPRARS